LKKELDIAQFVLFKDLPESTVKQMRSLMTEKSVAADQILFNQDEEGAESFLVVKGAVRIERLNKNGGRILLNILGPGEIFGEMSLITDSPRTAQATTHMNSTLLILKKSDFAQFLSLDPNMSERIMRVLSSRLGRTAYQLEETSLISLRSRLAGVLVDLIKRFGVQQGSEIILSIKVTQSDLGELVFSSREHVNKIIKSLEQDEIIKFNKGQIIAINLSELEKVHKNTSV